MPDAYWLEGLKRDPYHADCLLGMAKYRYQMGRLSEAERYARKGLDALTKFNMHTQSGDPYYLLGLILEAQERSAEAYDQYRKAAWNGSAVAKAMARAACIAMQQGDTEIALTHAQLALSRDAQHPLAPVVMILAYRETGNENAAQAVIDRVMAEDCMNNLVRWLGGVD